MELEMYPWKEEPVSPVGQDFEESWLLLDEDEEAKFPALKTEPLEDVWLPESPSGSNCSETSLTLSAAARAELASKLLVDLEQEEDLLNNDNHSLDWFEQKTDLPIFDELPSPPTPGTSPTHDCHHMAFAPMAPMAPVAPAFNIAMPVAMPVPMPLPLPNKMEVFGGATLSLPLTIPLSHDMVTLMPAQVVPQMVHQVGHTSDTASLLQEFEHVYDETVLTLGALTPPQSPPGAPVLHELKVASPRPSKDEVILPHSTDLTELDEIVRARAEETIFTSPLDPASPGSVTSASSCAHSLDEPSLSPSPTPSPAPSQESSDDPDWVPSPVASPPATVARGRGRKRAASSKPYGRATQEDKKLRKKEQNKNAATRYRLKKKMEVVEILGEEQELQDTNDQLKQRVTELSQEIRYLKDLMRDVCRAKGLIK